MNYWVKPPVLLKSLTPGLHWNFDRNKKEVFLTFDDGPTAYITRQILDLLDEYDAKATFFCLGGNVKRHPELYLEILNRGHRTGNHTWNHMNGWQFSDYSYFRNILECATLIESNLFRPPYGRITPQQARVLRQRFEIIMWDILSGDWDQSISPQKCLANVLYQLANGSIIVFHDSEKAKENMLYALPRTLAFLKKEGFQMRALSPDLFRLH